MDEHDASSRWEKTQKSNVRSLVLHVNWLGVRREIDRWGRLLIQKELRDRVELKGKVIVEGAENQLVLKKMIA